MKRNVGTTNMIYSNLNKKSICSYQSTISSDIQENDMKNNLGKIFI